jgi:hypothetical protein
VVSAEKQLTMLPQKKSKKNTPTEADQEDHYTEEDNGISHYRTLTNYRPRKKSKTRGFIESKS